MIILSISFRFLVLVLSEKQLGKYKTAVLNRITIAAGIVSITIVVIFLNALEVKAQDGPRPKQVIQGMDSDGDGRISEDEWLKPPQAFKRIDRDGNSFVTENELKTFFDKRFADQNNISGEKLGSSQITKTPSSDSPVMTDNGAIYEIIDTHVHLGAGPTQRDFAAGVSEALKEMSKRHVSLAILLPTPQIRPNQKRYDYKELRSVAHSNSFRIAGGSGVLGTMLHGAKTVTPDQKKTFHAMARSLANDGISAFGEIGLYHYAIPQLGNKFGFVPLDHPLLDVLGDVAAEAGIPIDVHFDVVPQATTLPGQLRGADNPDYLNENLSQFEEFLSRNRDTKIVWAHVGLEATPFRTATLCKKLLKRHKNLFMSIRLMRGAPKPSAAMDQSGRLKSEWKKLFTAFPDRFVLGSESMYGSTMSHMFNNQFILYQKLLSQLPKPVAQKIASDNARKIYPLGDS